MKRLLTVLALSLSFNAISGDLPTIREALDKVKTARANRDKQIYNMFRVSAIKSIYLKLIKTANIEVESSEVKKDNLAEKYKLDGEHLLDFQALIKTRDLEECEFIVFQGTCHEYNCPYIERDYIGGQLRCTSDKSHTVTNRAHIWYLQGNIEFLSQETTEYLMNPDKWKWTQD